MPPKEVKHCEAQTLEVLCNGGAQCFIVVDDSEWWEVSWGQGSFERWENGEDIALTA